VGDFALDVKEGLYPGGDILFFEESPLGPKWLGEKRLSTL